MAPDSETNQGSYPVGLEVRRYYIEAKSALMKRRYHPNPKWDNEDFWTRVGAVCLAIPARPDRFVAAQFVEARNRVDGPYPNSMLGRGATDRYRSWAKRNTPAGTSTQSAATDISFVLEAMKNAARDCETLFPGQPALVGYQSHMSMIPAWLRVLVFPENAEIVQTWGAQAKAELLSSPPLMQQCVAAGLRVDKAVTSF